MHRTSGVITVLLTLLLVVGATALAAPADRAAERVGLADSSAEAAASPEAAGVGPSQRLLDRIVSRLDETGITTDADAVAELAQAYGVGGAVRLLAWADAAGMSVEEIGAMFDAGMGWGRIARELNAGDESLSLHPGIGWIMGKGSAASSHGLGPAGAPGQQKRP